MNIKDVVDYLNFWINKKTNSYLTIEECVNILDIGQMDLFIDYKPRYATSQYIKDALAPFRATYDFTPSNTISGVIVVPSDSNYLDLLNIQIQFQISNRTVYFGVSMAQEDVISTRLNSQTDPVAVTSPVGEQLAPRYFRLYPVSGYTGTVTYFKRPIKPFYSYTIISGRVVVYNDALSTQLQWRDSEIPALVMKALVIAGVNLNDSDLVQIANIKSASNYMGQNKQ